MHKQGSTVVKEGSVRRSHKHEMIICPECKGTGKKLFQTKEEWYRNDGKWDTCDVCNGRRVVMQDTDINIFPIKD